MRKPRYTKISNVA